MDAGGAVNCGCRVRYCSTTPQKENSLSQQTWKDQLAKEWVYLCGIVLFTLIVWSVFFTIREPGGVERYFMDLTGGREAGLAWLITLAPYLLVQFIRSLMWSRKTLKSK